MNYSADNAELYTTVLEDTIRVITKPKIIQLKTRKICLRLIVRKDLKIKKNIKGQ